MKAFNQQVIETYRANNGELGDMLGGAPTLLLTTIGAKSGLPRTSPLVFTRDGDRIVFIASKAGLPTNPDWFINIVANPEVQVELAGETFTARAEIAAEPERTRLYDAQAQQLPQFREYQEKTDRVIPVLTISRSRASLA